MSKGLWANIDAKRKRGEAPAEPGDEDYPDEQTWNELSKTWQDILHKPGRCTRATKKTSSSRDSKKWMRCVKNPDGKGYKRIHWGDPNAKTRPGTEDAKNFRARHNCDSAKPGTPNAESCKDW